MSGVLFACLSGLCFGLLNITMRRGIARVPDVAAGSPVIAGVAFVLVATAAIGSGSSFEVAELWPFMLLGALVPGLSQLLVIRAVGAIGAARAGILFGMAPLFSATIAIVAFGEPVRLPLVAGTLLIVAGGVSLAREGERPRDYRRYGVALAVTVAIGFGLRDNLARSVSGNIKTDALAQATAIMLGATVVLLANLVRQPAAPARLRAAFGPFAPSGIVTALAQVTLFAALDRGRVTVVAPLVGTGVLWTVVFAAIFLGRSEPVGHRLFVVALLVVAGGALVGATH